MTADDGLMDAERAGMAARYLARAGTLRSPEAMTASEERTRQELDNSSPVVQDGNTATDEGEENMGRKVVINNSLSAKEFADKVNHADRPGKKVVKAVVNKVRGK